MSVPTPIREVVHNRFREVFGSAHHALGRDDHWALQPTPTASAINILVNGSTEAAAVWVFDPHDPKDGVMRTEIRSEAELDRIIAQIQERVRRAGLKRSGD